MGRKKATHNSKRQFDLVIDEKIEILKQLRVIGHNSDRRIKEIFINAIEKEPNSEPRLVIDRVARAMIMKNLK